MTGSTAARTSAAQKDVLDAPASEWLADHSIFLFGNLALSYLCVHVGRGTRCSRWYSASHRLITVADDAVALGNSLLKLPSVQSCRPLG
jgi:hypothetical protein